MTSDKPTVMVSSTVYFQQSLLDQICASLETYGYTVWMSHSGTIPLNPTLSNFENCLSAVETCHAFFGIITGRYGSGRTEGERSITHSEMVHAIRRKKPAWFLVHHDVVVARQLLKQFRSDPERGPWDFTFERTPVLEDIRVLEMYESAMRCEVPLKDRKGNWVQEYFYSHEALRFVDAQFSEVNRLQTVLGSNNG